MHNVRSSFGLGILAMTTLLVMVSSASDEAEKKTSPVHEAIKRGDQEAVVKHYAQRAGGDTTGDDFDDDGHGHLHQAVKAGNFKMVDVLINQLGVNHDIEDKLGRRPLHTALEHGQPEMAMKLLDMGANHSSQDGLERRPLQTAIFHKQTAIAKRLLKMGADPHEVTFDDRTNLHWAAERGEYELVKLFVEDHGLEIDRPDMHQRTPLRMAAIEGHSDVAHYLIDKGHDVNVEDWNGEKPIHHASLKGHTSIVKKLIESGSPVNDRARNGKTALHGACEAGDVEAIEFLVEKGFNIKGGDNDGRTPIRLAAQSGNPEAVRVLIEAKANLKSKDSTGQSALHIACKKGYFSIVKMLLKAKAGQRVKNDREGYNIPHCAVVGGNLEILKLVESIDTGLETKTYDHSTPLHTAAREGHFEVIEYILSKKIPKQLNARDFSSKTALLIAAQHGHIEVVKSLVKAGAALDGDRHLRGPLHYACERGSTDVAKYLLQNTPLNGLEVSDHVGSALHAAARYGSDLELIETIWKSMKAAHARHKATGNSDMGGAAELTIDSSVTPFNGRTALLEAAHHAEAVKWFLNQGADFTKEDDNGFQLLHRLAEFGNLAGTKYLFQVAEKLKKERKGKQDSIDINAQTHTTGDTPLHMAYSSMNVDLIKFLLRNGANPSIENNGGLVAHKAGTQQHGSEQEVTLENDDGKTEEDRSEL